MYVLGINAYHGDVSAALLRDGVLVSACEEERFRRIKHYAGFPTLAIKSVLAEAGIRGADVDHVAISRAPRAHLLRKGLAQVTGGAGGKSALSSRRQGYALTATVGTGFSPLRTDS